MTDMRAKFEGLRGLWEPGGAGAGVQYSRDRFTDLFADDAHVFIPGTWFLAGHHHGRPTILKMFEAVHKVWPIRATFHRNHYWIGEDTMCIEWFSTNGTWKNQRCRNSGMTIWRFRGDLVIDWQEITDSEYFDEAHSGWREHLGADPGRFLARYAQQGPPWYPDPAANEWPLDTCPSDGRSFVPPELKADVEAAEAFWRDPRKGDAKLFADDAHVFFQGRSWPLGGHHHGRAALERVSEASRRIWPDAPRIVKTNLWARDGRVLVQWFAKSRTWKGQDCRNSGWTIWTFRDHRVVDARTYTDTSFYAEVHAGWREHFGAELASQLPNWPVPQGAKYPRPEEHE